MNNLKQLRESSNLTLLEVSLKLGYKYSSSYAKIENGIQPIKTYQVPLLSSLFNVSEEKILQLSYSFRIKGGD